jgi:hypothetical protein
MPPIEQVEFDRDAIRPIPGLMLGEIPVQRQLERRLSELVDVFVDDEIQDQDDVDVPRRLEKSIVAPSRIALLKLSAQSVVLANEDAADGRVKYGGVSAFETCCVKSRLSRREFGRRDA